MNTEFFTKSPPVKTIIYWKGFIAKLIVSCIVTVALAVSTGLSGVNDWSQLAGTQKIIIICGIVGVAGNNIISLLDKSFAGLSGSKPQDPTKPPTP